MQVDTAPDALKIKTLVKKFRLCATCQSRPRVKLANGRVYSQCSLCRRKTDSDSYYRHKEARIERQRIRDRAKRRTHHGPQHPPLTMKELKARIRFMFLKQTLV
jgi:hypothetical protein